ncbi:MAG: TonB-dependent receptor plug domain-containing protein, partial [Tannerella sp.]|nr:TonB-dependent receptor plug domain-containing protein [Tannerella sp.]
VAAFARPEISNELEKVSGVQVSEIVPEKPSSSDTLRLHGNVIAVKDSTKREFTVVKAAKKVSGKRAQVLVIIDGAESKEDLDSLDPETIESISVFKDETAVSHYGEKGKNGVILITTKNGKKKSDQ